MLLQDGILPESLFHEFEKGPEKIENPTLILHFTIPEHSGLNVSSGESMTSGSTRRSAVEQVSVEASLVSDLS